MKEEENKGSNLEIKIVSSDSISSEISASEDEYWKKVLTLCDQTHTIPFGLQFPSNHYEKLGPIDSGSYSIVVKGFDKALRKEIVFKIIDVVSLKIANRVNGLSLEKKELLADVFSEIKISKALSGLHQTIVDSKGHEFIAHTFPKILDFSLVHGRVANYFTLKQTDDSVESLEKTHYFDESPGIPKEYLVMKMKNCGQPLWKMINEKKVHPNQLISVCIQLTLALTVAEVVYEFEHRDLHISNVLIKKTKKKTISYILNTVKYDVESNGIKAFIIDTTFSRLRIGTDIYFSSLSNRLNPKLNIKKPDPQDSVYKKMSQMALDDWKKWNPLTNIYWLSYFYQTIISCKLFDTTDGQIYKKQLSEFVHKISKCNSLEEYILNHFAIN